MNFLTDIENNIVSIKTLVKMYLQKLAIIVLILNFSEIKSAVCLNTLNSLSLSLYLSTSDDSFHLVVAFARSLDKDQARQNV